MNDLRSLVDDPTILDDEIIFRIIPPRVVKSWDPPIMSSNAFGDQTIEIANGYGLADRCASVALESVWSESSGKIEELLRNHDSKSGVAQMTAGDLRDLHTGNGETPRPQGIMRDPQPDAPWHAVVFDLTSIPRSSGAKNSMRAIATWFHEPTKQPEAAEPE